MCLDKTVLISVERSRIDTEFKRQENRAMQESEKFLSDQQTPGLQRIICIDAHIPRKRMEVKLSRHANISGSNGSGKTTLLKLVPFFYGATPIELVERVGKKTSFTDYYLARPTSLIVFEYMTARGLKCAVTYRHASGTKPAYRFLDEPFSVEYFSEIKEDKPVFIEGRALGRHWTMLRLGHSNQLDTVIDYRAVIQGDRSLVARSSMARELLGLVAMYSLGGVKGCMANINKMTSAILSRRGNMEGIKQMIAEIMREEQIELPQIQLHKNVREIVAELGVLRNLEKSEKLFRKAVDLGTNYQENSTLLRESAQELRTHFVKEGDKAESLENEMQVNRKNMDTLKFTWEEVSGDIRRQQQDAEHTRDTAEKNRDHLDDAKQGWIEENIHQKLNEFDSLGEFETALSEAEDHKRVLEEGVRDLKLHYDGLEQKETRRHSEKITRLTAIKAKKTQAVNNEEKRWLEEKNALESEQHRAVNALRELREENIYILKDEVTTARIAAKNIMPTEDEKLAEAIAQSQRDQLEQKLTEASDAVDLASGAVMVAKQEEQEAGKFRVGAHKKFTEEGEKLERLSAVCNPRPGSFLSELRKHDETWHNSIGKVIREDLLDRRDLSPIYTSDSADSVMGWTLKLDSLDKPDWAGSLEQQQMRRAEQEECLDLAEKQFELKVSEHNGALKVLSDAQSVHDEKKREMGQTHRLYQSAKQAVQMVRSQNQLAADERKAAAAERHDALKKSLEELKMQVEKELEDINKRFATNLKSAHDQYLIQLAELEEGETLAEEAVQAEVSHHKERLNEIAREYKNQCAQQGLDEEVLNTAIKRVKQAKTKCETVRGYQQAVLEYRHWVKNAWPRRPDYEARRAEESKKSQELGAKYKEKERKYKRERDELNAAYNELRNHKTKATENRDKCELMLKRALYTWLREIVDKPRPIESVLADVELLLHEQQTILKEVRSSIAKVESVISGQGDSNQITEAWEQLRKQAEAATNDLNNVDALNINLTRSINELLAVHLPQKKETLGSYVQTISGQLENFYVGLKQISKLIQQQSRAISASISEKHYFEAIGNIDVSLSSRIDSQDYWPHLEEFAILYDKWRDVEGISLPPEELGDLLIKVTDILHRSKVATGIESVFDLAITLEENGRKVTVTNGRDLENASSNGLSYLILCCIFAGITRMLCRDWSIRIHWPVDELGVIDSVNIAGLFKMLNDHNIVMVGGFPTTDPLLLQHFREKHEIRKGVGIVDIALPEDKLVALMQARRATNKHEVTDV